MKVLTSIFVLLLISLGHGQKKLDSLRTLLVEEGLSQHARVDILNELGYENWIVDTEKSLEYGKQALLLAEDSGYGLGSAKAKRIIGVAHWAQGDPKKALENLGGAISAYEKLGDDTGLANCYLNTGMVYADIQYHDKAQDLYEKAITKFTTLGLKDRIATTYTKMADILTARNSLYDAKRFLDNALAIHRENNFSYGMGEVHNRLGRLFIMEGELEQAEYHIRESTIQAMEVGDVDGHISNLILFGRLLRLQNNLEASQIHLDLALTKADNKNLKKYKLDALRELKLLKKQQGNWEESLEYYDRYIALKDSIFNTDKSKQIAAIEFENELLEKDQQLDYLQQIKRSDTRIKWILAIAIAIIALLAIFLVRSLDLKNRKQRELLESKERLSTTAMENQRLKQLELEGELHFKNKELASYALNFVQKNELLEKLYSQLRNIRGATPKDQASALNQIERTIRQHRSLEKDWEDFKNYFDQVHGRLLGNLKENFPGLSGNDLKVAALARLNLNIKETSNILGISPESAKTARYRLRKKLKMAQDDDLFSFLAQWDR